LNERCNDDILAQNGPGNLFSGLRKIRNRSKLPSNPHKKSDMYVDANLKAASGGASVEAIRVETRSRKAPVKARI
jgi:hypothetical protein